MPNTERENLQFIGHHQSEEWISLVQSYFPIIAIEGLLQDKQKLDFYERIR